MLAENGDLASHTRNCGRKSAVTDEHKQLILEHFSKNPESTLDEAITALNLPRIRIEQNRT